jgi:serine/threonine protein phosphatase PrpC
VVEAHGLTNAGPVRRTNEDSFISDPALQLFMVADGMGGHAAGEVASSLAVETVLGSSVGPKKTQNVRGRTAWNRRSRSRATGFGRRSTSPIAGCSAPRSATMNTPGWARR